MTAHRFSTSRPCHWIEPRNRNAMQHTHGKIVPLTPPSWLARLLGRG